MEDLKKTRTRAAICGAAAGAINGLLGAGGGIILIPLFSKWLKLPKRETFATALGVMLPLAAVSAVSYLITGVEVQLSQLWPYLLGGAAGGYIGGRLIKKIPIRLLRLLFAAILIYGGVRSLLA